jgi:hypothetical protein
MEYRPLPNVLKGIGALIIFGRWPSMSAHENESMLRTYLVCRESERERETSKRDVGETQCTNSSDPTTSSSELLLRENMSLRMLADRPLRNRDPPAKTCRLTCRAIPAVSIGFRTPYRAVLLSTLLQAILNTFPPFAEYIITDCK